MRRFLSAGLLACSLLIANSGSAQAPPPAAPAWDGHVVWVLPFDNQSAQPGVEWIGASFPDLINQ
ncbi:MAG TPA: hypothetical protein VFN53_05655, partial [Acidobacteriaceae bacterium]|nr:hypothetical protein [Acidobacteriaceae bacterium]